MSDDEVQRQAMSFGAVADAYDRGRPGYPAAAAAWLTGDEPLTVLELGAGTGKLTEQLVALGHDVHATDPDEGMLEILRANLPGVRTSVGGAEEIPAPDNAYDVVVGAQCFHWFDHEKALPEIRRVLKPRGRLSLVWNVRDERIPWIKKLGRVIGTQEQLTDPTEILQASLRFIIVEEQTFKHWQTVDRRSIQDLVASRSNIATLDDEARAAKMQELLELYDSYGRGMDGMQLHYEARCFRSRVVKSPIVDASPPTGDADAHAADTPDGASRPTSPPRDDDDGTLLIDFR